MQEVGKLTPMSNKVSVSTKVRFAQGKKSKSVETTIPASVASKKGLDLDPKSDELDWNGPWRDDGYVYYRVRRRRLVEA